MEGTKTKYAPVATSNDGSIRALLICLLKEDRTFWYIMVGNAAWEEALFEVVLVG